MRRRRADMKHLQPSMCPRKRLKRKKKTKTNKKVSPAAVNVPKQLAHKVLSFLHLEKMNSSQTLSDHFITSLHLHWQIVHKRLLRSSLHQETSSKLKYGTTAAALGSSSSRWACSAADIGVIWDWHCFATFGKSKTHNYTSSYQSMLLLLGVSRSM